MLLLELASVYLLSVIFHVPPTPPYLCTRLFCLPESPFLHLFPGWLKDPFPSAFSITVLLTLSSKVFLKGRDHTYVIPASHVPGLDLLWTRCSTSICCQVHD